MRLNVQQESGTTARSASDVRAMALAVQANLVHLKVIDSKRRGIPTDQHELKVPAPGFVRDFRETLIDPAVVAGYPDEFVQLRLRELWGRFCMMLWLFSYPDPPEQASFATLPLDAELRCGPAVEAKHAEVHALLWRLRQEHRRRHDPEYIQSAGFADDQALAQKIPAEVYGKPAADCSDIELLQAACEYAGMLAAIRWAMGRIPTWGDEAAMLVDEKPF